MNVLLYLISFYCMTVFIYYKVFTHQPAWTNHVTHILSTPLPSYKSQGSPSCPVWLSGGLLITVVNVIIANDFRKHGHDRNSVTLRGKVRWMWERKGKADEDIHKIFFTASISYRPALNYPLTARGLSRQWARICHHSSLWQPWILSL